MNVYIIFWIVLVLWFLTIWSEANERIFIGIPASGQTLDDCSCEDEKAACRCTGLGLKDVPTNLPKPLKILSIDKAGIEVLKRDSLRPYANSLKELILVNLEEFYFFEAGVFFNLNELQTLYIHGAPKLLKIQPGVFNVALPNLKVLRIVSTGLEEMPYLNFYDSSVLFIMDFENNRIQHIKSHQITNVKAEQLLLDYNDLRTIEEEAFYGSEIAKLSFKGNLRLVNLHSRAFAGLQSLRDIDLSSTAIESIPVEGMHEIDVLKVRDTHTLKVFPSVYNFQNIKEAWLTYPYHCCAFKFPDTHDPRKFDEHQLFVQQLKAMCSSTNLTTVGLVLKDDQHSPALKAVLRLLPLNTSIVAQETMDEEFWWHDEEVFRNDTLKMSDGFPATTVICGEIYRDYHEVKCYPEPDAFNPCEDLMGNWALRVPVWFISLSAVIGNLFVVIVIATSHFRLTVSKFLMCNLATADLCIGIHLLLIAVVDAKSIGVYFNYAIDWQEGVGCEVAGFLTIFGNVLSVYTLAVITTERWYTITWAIHLNKRLKLRTAVRVMFAGWLCAICMASLPLFGISSYSRISICLPLENKGKADTVYLSTLLAFNAIAFSIICVCYASMYRSIREGGNQCSITSVRSDLTVAKRMALLVFTDFACWAPIAFFGLTALLGYPLITVTQTKILLVFFYPLNSCANPCLYTLLTQQYRRDFFILMGRYGICKDRAERHKGAIGGKPLPYGAGGQYRRNPGEVNKAHSATGNNHRSSVLTTIVSVELPISKIGSKSGSFNRDNISKISEYPLQHLNKMDQQNNCKLTSTNNL
ncbi:PREDICTED: lutropin-choriogonadotropic hormone receptor-like [Nicrophorus vespilloides]|uniref:Lutropin-choriogonadotropic hormone receptor-like n=1 Tax=Nicrophorus vespilloides TaxID=110193 RepID=A0ABM1NE48_NICVS|nr:PREDICTED: lutropin-choriogonadotropic hormone receptor-like [Nicrophorus vespilloides]